jgi:prepilin-type N-terminal cleavage/methylation domain-containing protein
MLKNLRKNNEGFTIIEVLIVLAIAGLIMLIVFLAVPALQRNQRNNARNSEAARISASITECLANRNGSTAVAGGCGSPGQLNYGNLQQLDGTVTLRTGTLSTVDGTPTTGGSTVNVQYQFGAICNSTTTGALADSSSRKFVVLYQLEPAVNRCVGSE